jgi:hypothetical protein
MNNNPILLTAISEINGKKLSKSQINLFKKMASLGVKVHAIGPEKRFNRYSGVSCELCPIAATLFDFIIQMYDAGMVGRLFPVSVWDKARYTFLEFWPDSYYKLID